MPEPLPVPLPVERLRAEAAAGRIETVVVAVPDLLGRLQGSRLDAGYFCDRVLTDGFAACGYLLATDVEMNTGPGYALDAWGSGFGDLLLVPDPATLRELPWDPGTALVIADAHWPADPAAPSTTDALVPFAPRRVLTAQLDRLAERGLTAYAGTELEFLLFAESFDVAYDRDYRGLRPATRHNVDYSLTGVTGIEPVVGRIRREMKRAGLRLESARGECHPGQYEIVFRYADALTTCDNHVLYKTGVRQIAAQEQVAVTFMAKYDAGEGNSCHVHLSLRYADGTPAFAADGAGDAAARGPTGPTAGMSALMAHFVAGQLAALPELTLLFAPGVNSYKRLAPGSFAPTQVGWGRDNRTCPVRVVGAGDSLRIEHRVAGGDANPYTVVAAIVAAGLYGIDHELPLPPAVTGNATDRTDLPRLPTTLGEAVALWEGSGLARSAFGADVVRHHAAAARAELAEYGRAVTDWERHRGFERW
ncbi:glutamine synthetase [Micromonospora echinofusca]|uniref:Glutamine synthetase n=1 Tax=Micromonospora echinofusca TaxID=47858 RepID=A0ABS3W098_MICEH|nr:glutamine synthetase [Micromonospora echinofusca]